MTGTVRIGCGAGFQGDRLEPALILAEHGKLDYLMLECLGERTVALAQLRKLHDPGHGYDSLLERRMTGLLPLIKRNGVRVVTNMGAANPLAGAEKIVAIAKTARPEGARRGADRRRRARRARSGADRAGDRRAAASVGALFSANAYLGVEAMLPALESGADIVLTGRVADPSLALAPLAHHFGWTLDDAERFARGTVVGHLLECAGQITGGYYADPGKKDVPGMARLGFPFADVDADGNATLSKVAGTGGTINRMTATEQLLYEVTDPTRLPDARRHGGFFQRRDQRDRAGHDRGERRARPQAARHAESQRRLSRRLYRRGRNLLWGRELRGAGRSSPARSWPSGCAASSRNCASMSSASARCIRARCRAATIAPTKCACASPGARPTAQKAALIGEEVEALWTNGPAGGGGARKETREQIGIVSCLMARDKVKPQVTVLET